MRFLTAIGLMSGTSLDGVDVALIETDGERIKRQGPVGYRSYSRQEQSLLRRALGEGAALTDRTARPGVLAEAEALVTRAHAEAVEGTTASAAHSNTGSGRKRIHRRSRGSYRILRDAGEPQCRTVQSPGPMSSLLSTPVGGNGWAELPTSGLSSLRMSPSSIRALLNEVDNRSAVAAIARRARRLSANTV